MLHSNSIAKLTDACGYSSELRLVKKQPTNQPNNKTKQNKTKNEQQKTTLKR